MENNTGIRWKQRFENFQKAFTQLAKFIEKQELNELEEQGLVKAFEYTYELACNVMKDYYQYQGEENIQGSRDAIRLAFKRGLVEDGEGWMAMIKSRIMSSHTYNEELVQEIKAAVFNEYYPLFERFNQKMNKLCRENLD